MNLDYENSYSKGGYDIELTLTDGFDKSHGNINEGGKRVYKARVTVTDPETDTSHSYLYQLNYWKRVFLIKRKERTEDELFEFVQDSIDQAVKEFEDDEQLATETDRKRRSLTARLNRPHT